MVKITRDSHKGQGLNSPTS